MVGMSRIGAVLGAAGLAFVLGLPGVAHAERVLKLEPYAGKLRQVTVCIAGGDHKFLFDSAGGHTLISPAIASTLGCNPSGRILGFRMNGDRFESPKCESVRYKIGAFTSAAETVGVFDLMTLLPKELPPIEGLI